MDGANNDTDNHAVRLGEAIDAAITDAGQTRQGLADALGIHASQVTRMIKGQMPDITVARVIQIEEALGAKRGTLLRGAGYIEDDVTIFDLIRAADLTAQEKTALRVTVERFLPTAPPS